MLVDYNVSAILANKLWVQAVLRHLIGDFVIGLVVGSHHLLPHVLLCSMLWSITVTWPIPNYTKLYCVVTEAHVYEQLAKCHYTKIEQLRVAPVMSTSVTWVDDSDK